MLRLEHLEMIIDKHTDSTLPVQSTKPRVVSAESGPSCIDKNFSLKLEVYDPLGEEFDAALYDEPLGGIRGILTLWGPRSSDNPIFKATAYSDKFVWEMSSFHKVYLFPQGTQGHNEALLIVSILKEIADYAETG